MGHAITALIVPEPCDGEAAREWDVLAAPLRQGLRLVPVDHYYTAYWQARRGESARLDVPDDYPTTFPREGVVLTLAGALSARRDPTFALVMTGYFGGVGDQWACAYAAGQRLGDVRDINDALRALGVRADGYLDEFDAVGLGRHRHPPDHLQRYVRLCDELGV